MTRPTHALERSTYRHGDLKRALLDAGIELARSGGPQAVVLREATRRTGVVPNAAYRHFASHQQLMSAVRAAALSALAMAMEDELAALPRSGKPKDQARACLRAVGTGYLRFARAEPGLFRTAAAFSEDDEAGDPAKAGRSGLNPFELLCAALDRFVDAGLLPAAQRPGAEYLAWSAVHGMALLAMDGPLRRLPDAQLGELGQHLLQMVEKGLQQAPRGRKPQPGPCRTAGASGVVA